MDCSNCKHIPRIDTQLSELTKFKDRMVRGTVIRIWTAIEKRASKALLITFAVTTISFVGTLFSLVYHTQNKVLEQISQVNTRIAVIETKIKKTKEH